MSNVGPTGPTGPEQNYGAVGVTGATYYERAMQATGMSYDYYQEQEAKGRPLRTYFFQSGSNASKFYQTIQWENGSLSCDCFGWIKRVAGGVRTCKHVRIVIAGLGTAQAFRVVDHLPIGISVPQKDVADDAPKENVRAFKFEQ